MDESGSNQGTSGTLDAEERLLLSEALAAGPMGTWSFDPATGLFTFTDEFYRLFRTSAEAEGGHQMSASTYAERFLPAEVQPVVQERIGEAFASTDPNFRGVVEHAVTFADGSAGHIQVSYRVLWDDSGAPTRLIGVNQDISSRKANELKLERLAAELKTTNDELKNEAEAARSASRAKSTFLANMSHEIRTPMNGVLGMAELLLESDLSEEQRDLLKTLYRSADSLLTVLNDILDFSKIEAGRIAFEERSFSLSTLFEDVVALFQGKACSKGIALNLNCGCDGNDYRLGDPTRIRQILSNLVGNAVKFTDSGVVRVTCSADESGVTIRVQDEGIGISTSQQERLFQPFIQADESTTRRFGGTGLGLAISKQLAEAMGGRLCLSSELGQGSEFVVEIPLARSQPPTPELETRATGRAPSTGRRLSVLLAEDNPVNQKLIRKMFAAMDHELKVVDDGEEALTECQKQEFDVVLMDCQMPKMDGFAATRKIRSDSKCAQAFVVALTANAMQGDRERCIEAGMDDYLAKPLRLKELRTLLEQGPNAEGGYSRKFRHERAKCARGKD